MRSEQDGFSLIELLLAMAVVLIVALGIGEMMLTSLKANRDSDLTTVATGLASAKLNELTQYAYDDAALAAGNYSDTVDDFDNMTRSWTVEENTPHAGVKRITVTVASKWAGFGTARTVTLVSYRTSPTYASGIAP